MLISFSVANFRSFGEEVTLNMVASNKLTDHPNHRVSIPGTDKHVLRAAVIYGANAAGKSNLIQAMAFAQRLIREGGRVLQELRPFRFRNADDTSPTTFEFRFLVRDQTYVYGIDVVESRVLGEWLIRLAGTAERVAFERGPDDDVPIRSDSNGWLGNDPLSAKTLRDAIQLPLSTDEPLLHRLFELPREKVGQGLSSVLDWLTKHLCIVDSEHLKRADEELLRDESLRALCGKLLRAVDTGIEDVRLDVTSIPSIELRGGFAIPFDDDEPGGLSTYTWTDEGGEKKLLRHRIVAVHAIDGRSFNLPIGAESDGTRQLLSYLPFLVRSQNSPTVLVIDELDRSLHPLLCWEFVRLFSETEPGAQKQLIVTTHEAHLLNQDLLRRDEYWFVEKDDQQQSRLVPLSDFKVRNDLQLEKGYLQGRFGAIPMIGSMRELEKLLESGQENGADAEETAPAES